MPYEDKPDFEGETEDPKLLAMKRRNEGKAKKPVVDPDKAKAFVEGFKKAK